MRFFAIGKWGQRLILFLFFFLIAFIHVNRAEYYEQKYDRELIAFDLNNDGVYSQSEMTEEAKIAMEHVANDTGRQFAPFSALILSTFFTILCWASSLAIQYRRE